MPRQNADRWDDWNIILHFRIPVGYNPDMSFREISPVARLIAGVVSYVGVVVVAIWMLGGEAWRMFTLVTIVLGKATGPFLGAGVVWLIVRCVNRRDDPICQNRIEQER
jgi:hypothetical protein